MSLSRTRLDKPWFRACYAFVLAGTPLVFYPGVGSWFLERGNWWIAIFLRAFAVSFLICPLTIELAKRLGVMDRPNSRKIHAKPMPRLGGLAVLAGLVLAAGPYAADSAPLAALLLGGAGIYALSVLDDAKPLPATLRLIVQILICILVLASGINLNTFPIWLEGQLWLNGLLTAFWIIGLLNAVNFLDGIDGLVGSLGVLCAFLFLAIGWETRQSYLAVLTAALAGGCLGFLPYNFHRSVTFLGDGGATLIGFLLAGVAVWGSWSERGPVVAFSTPLLILSIPIFDMIYTTISRVKNGQVRNFTEWIEFTGKDHFHHRLMKLGMSQVQAMVFILALSLALGLGGLVIRTTRDMKSALLLVGQSFLIFSVIAGLMILAREKAGEKKK